ncbi:MAG: hypothetical protein ACRYFU_10870, partial [Janthinobacterium lividum]
MHVEYAPKGECAFMGKIRQPTEQLPSLDGYRGCDFQKLDDPRVGALVNELIGHVADKWTMI